MHLTLKETHFEAFCLHPLQLHRVTSFCSPIYVGELLTPTTPLFSGRGSVGSVSGSRPAGLKLTEFDMLLVWDKCLII